MLKRIVIKICLLVAILFVLNGIYSGTLYHRDLQEKSKELILIRETQPSTDIFYFGESSNVTYLPTDSLKNSISEFTSMFYPELKLTNTNKYATHGGVYKYWLKYLDQTKKLPKAVIVTLNLRSFNAAWIHSDLETQLQESLVFSRPFPPLINRFMLSLQAFDNKTTLQREQEMLHEWRVTPLRFPYEFKYRTVSEWDNAMALGGYTKADGSWDMDKIVLACHYIKAYAFNLDENNPRIVDFDEIYSWSKEHKVHLYLNLMAENIEYADSLVGKDLVFLMKENRDYLVRRYNRGFCKVIDNLEAVAGKDFIDQKWTTEHYNQAGRRAIAKNLSDTLKKQFKTEYKNVY